MLHVSVNLMRMQYAYPMFTKSFEMRYPVLKEVCSPYAKLLPWQHTLYTYHLILSELFAPLIVLHPGSNLTPL